MRTTYWNHIPKPTQQLQPAHQCLVGVNGTPLATRGTAKVEVVLGGQSFLVPVTVVDDITADIILGIDFLKAEKCIVDLGHKTLELPARKTLLKLQTEGQHDKGMCGVTLPVSCASTTDVPAYSEVEVQLELPEGVEGDWLVEGFLQDKVPVVTARTIVCPCDRTLVARVMNPTPKVVRIYQGTKLGQAERLPDEGVVSVVTMDGPTDAGPTTLQASDDSLWEMVTRRGDEGVSLDLNQQEQLFAVLKQHRKAFAAGPGDCGRTDQVRHRIQTPNCAPVRQAPRKLPAGLREEARQALTDMLERNVVSPSQSPWSSPVVLVRKRDGSARFCVDYRKVNALTTKDAYPLPRIDETLDTLSGAKWFSTLDLISGYWQVEIEECDREKTAFCTSEGLYQFNVMPFGLCNAPATFQRLMDTVLAGLQWDHCLVYLDDIIVVGRTFEEHLTALRLVLERLERAGLKLKPTKCHLCQSEVQYLGHVVSAQGVAVDPSKTDRVRNWPKPQNKLAVQQFLGLASYYRRFVPNFATIAQPLHRLTEKTVPFVWNEGCQHAFEKLKEKLTTTPILAFPDFSCTFLLDTDASDYGIGAVLSQVATDGGERVIAYASRVLSKPERNYCVTRRELLAVVYFTDHFRQYLLGRQFSLRTDHQSISWLQNFKEPQGQLARWLERLQEYDFTIVHRPGKHHGNADALSRRPCNQCGQSDTPSLRQQIVGRVSMPTGYTADELRQAQLNDPVVGPVLRAKEEAAKPTTEEVKSQPHHYRRLVQLWDQLVIERGMLHRCYETVDGSGSHLQLVVPQSLRNRVLKEVHGGAMSGHLGQGKALSRLQERFYWPGFHADVKLWCESCEDCARRKAPTPKRRAPLHGIRVGNPMQLVAVDIMGPFPVTSNGNQYVLVAGDYFTRWMEAYAIPNQEAETVARKLTEEMFFRFSPPEQLHSDQGRQFEGRLIAQICRMLGISKTRTTPYHPQGDGLVERFNRTLVSMLSVAVQDRHHEWEDHLRATCMAYNTSVQSTTGFTPFYLMFGREARMPLDMMFGHPDSSPEGASDSEYAVQLRDRLQRAYLVVRTNFQRAFGRQKIHYDQKVHGKPLAVGDLVWLHSPVVPAGRSKKLHRPWTGPFKILKKLSEQVYRIQSTVGTKRRLVVHFDRLKPYQVNLPEQSGDLPPSDSPSSVPPSNQSRSFGEQLQVVEDSSPAVALPTPSANTQRYPRRERRPPDRFSDGLYH